MPDYTILIVDYEPRTAEKARGPLVSAGFSVEVATDGFQAVKAFRKHQPLMTLIEVMLPKKSGLEVCQELKGLPGGGESTIVVMSSRFRSRQYRNQALHRYGADEFLEKPVSEEALHGLMDKFLRDKIPCRAATRQPATPTSAETPPAMAPAAVVVPLAEPAAPPPATAAASGPAAPMAKDRPTGSGIDLPTPAVVMPVPDPGKKADDPLESEITDRLDDLLGDLGFGDSGGD